jgi:hypothetical protein
LTALNTGKHYDLIGANTLFFVYPVAFHNTVHSVSFLSGNKKDAFLIQGCEPAVIGIGTIFDNN